jgi:AcrR family transcriptional regulator
MDFTLNEIAVHSGLKAALVRYYFGNKRGLLLAVVELVASQSLGQLNEQLSMDLPPEKKLRLHIGGVIKAYWRHPYFNQLIHSLHDQDDREVTKLFLRPLLNARTRSLKEGCSAGVFCKVDPIFFYMSVIGACHSLFYGGRTLRTALGIAEVTDDLRQQYSNYVATMVLSAIVIPTSKSNIK